MKLSLLTLIPFLLCGSAVATWDVASPLWIGDGFCDWVVTQRTTLPNVVGTEETVAQIPATLPAPERYILVDSMAMTAKTQPRIILIVFLTLQANQKSISLRASPKQPC